MRNYRLIVFIIAAVILGYLLFSPSFQGSILPPPGSTIERTGEIIHTTSTPQLLTLLDSDGNEFEVTLASDATITDEEGNPASFESFLVGDRVSVKGVVEDEMSLLASRLTHVEEENGGNEPGDNQDPTSPPQDTQAQSEKITITSPSGSDAVTGQSINVVGSTTLEDAYLQVKLIANTSGQILFIGRAIPTRGEAQGTKREFTKQVPLPEGLINGLPMTLRIGQEDGGESISVNLTYERDPVQS